MNKILPACLVLIVVGLMVALVVEHRKTQHLVSSLELLSKDRDAMGRELKDLGAKLAQLQKTRPATTSAATAGTESAAASASTAARATPEAKPGVTITAPPGWVKNGSKVDSYVVGVDSLETWGGMPSAYVQSLEPSPSGFGGMMQTASAEPYVGKRVRLSGWIKTEDANDGGGHLWLRVDGQVRGESLQFDNMDNRPVKGTSDWREASVVLDVPEGATALAYGFFLGGGGKMWVSGQRMEEVGADVPSTNMIVPRPAPKGPTNLGFNPRPPR